MTYCGGAMPAALDRRGKGLIVLPEDGLALLLAEPAWNDAELGQTLADFRRLGEAP